MTLRRCSFAAFITIVFVAATSQAGFAAGSFEVLGAMQDDSGQGSLNGGVLDFSPGGNSGPVEAPHTVAFTRDLEPGSILVRTSERKLYFVLPSGQALVYPIGVGRDGFRWSGTNRISRKQEWPEWRPPKVMIAREMARGHYIPEFMAGGEGNPLGARALYIGQTEFRIHGTTQPWSIGKAVSSGCIRMLNEQVIDLYDRVAIGARVIVE